MNERHHTFTLYCLLLYDYPCTPSHNFFFFFALKCNVCNLRMWLQSGIEFVFRLFDILSQRIIHFIWLWLLFTLLPSLFFTMFRISVGLDFWYVQQRKKNVMATSSFANVNMQYVNREFEIWKKNRQLCTSTHVCVCVFERSKRDSKQPIQNQWMCG